MTLRSLKKEERKSVVPLHFERERDKIYGYLHA